MSERHAMTRLSVPRLVLAHVLVAVILAGLARLPVALDVWIATAVLGCGLIGASVTDIRTGIIPDLASIGLLAVGLLSTWMFQPGLLGIFALTALIWLTFLIAISELYYRWRGVEGFGWGDAKLMAAAGAWLGPLGSLNVLVLASLSGVLWIVVRSLLMRKQRLDQGLAFGPFLGLCVWIVWLFGPVV